MESTLYKNIQINKHSGIFYGPVTAVYGIGIISLELLNKYIFKKMKSNKFLKLIIEFVIITLILSLIEYLGGTILNSLFGIDMWDYSKEKIHFGKYLCLRNSIIWGLLGLAYINIFKPFTDKIINQITKKETYLFLNLFTLDLIITLITKL
jgi:uncharacterized membrane protein